MNIWLSNLMDGVMDVFMHSLQDFVKIESELVGLYDLKMPLLSSCMCLFSVSLTFSSTLADYIKILKSYL